MLNFNELKIKIKSNNGIKKTLICCTTLYAWLIILKTAYLDFKNGNGEKFFKRG